VQRLRTATLAEIHTVPGFGGKGFAFPTINLAEGGIIPPTPGGTIARIGEALQDPAFTESSVYNQISQFYPRYQEFQTILNKAKVSNYAELTAKGGLATLMRNELVSLAEELMLENPSFSRMYYGVFAGQLKG
jgi:hypothetical protein